MPLRLKLNILEKLKEKGYTTYRIRKDELLNDSTVSKLRKWENWEEGKGISWASIATVCKLLNCQPGDLMEYIPD